MIASLVASAVLFIQDPTDPSQYILPWASSSTEIKDVAFSPDSKYFALISPASAAVWSAETSLPGPFTTCFPSSVAWDSTKNRFAVNVFHEAYNGVKHPQSLRFKSDDPEDLGYGGQRQGNGPTSNPYGITYNQARVYAESNVPGLKSQSIDRSFISLTAHIVLAGPNKTFWVQESTQGEVTVTEAKGERVKPKWNPQKCSSGPFTIHAGKSLIAGRDAVINFNNGKPFTEPGVGTLNTFSYDGSTLVSINAKSKKVNFREMKTNKLIEISVTEPESFGRLLPSPDGSYVVLTDQADPKRNIFAQPGGRRAWQVFRTGQVFPLEDGVALSAYVANVTKYLGDKERIDKILRGTPSAGEPAQTSSSYQPSPTARPASYPTKSNMGAVDRAIASAKAEGFRILEDTTVQGKGRGGRSFSYGPFKIEPGNEYFFIGAIDASIATGRTYVNFHKYTPDERGKFVSAGDYMCNMELAGSAIYNAQRILVAKNTADATYKTQEMIVSATCGGFEQMRIIVLKRRLP